MSSSTASLRSREGQRCARRLAVGRISLLRTSDPVCSSSPDRIPLPPPPLSFLDLNLDPLAAVSLPTHSPPLQPHVSLQTTTTTVLKGPTSKVEGRSPSFAAKDESLDSAEDEALDFVAKVELAVEVEEEEVTVVWRRSRNTWSHRWRPRCMCATFPMT